jgi:hypothetical protein
MKISQVAILTVVICGGALCQEFRSTISGAVTDPTGAAVPNAPVVAIETRTNTKTQTTSDSSGQYAIPFLAPGRYDLIVTVAGFKEYFRKDIQLTSGEHPVLDIQLSVGDTSQAVEVTAETPLINTENASTGQSITTKQVEDLPLNGRTPLMLAQLSIGVISTTQPSLVHPFDAGAPSALSIGGLPSQTTELLLDGSPDATWDLRLAYSPPQDAVQEVRVKAFDTDAAYGHTGSGTANVVLKTGTNALHGSLWEFNQPNNLGANTFFNDKNGAPTPVTHLNQYGATAGGPVIIPKLFNGRDKLFWFFGWESMVDSQPNSTLLTVPTAEERVGNFSALLAAGSQFQLFDPTTAVLNGSVVTRKPFLNNVIPTKRLNPIALAYLNFYPLPNVTQGVGPTGVNNYLSNATTNDDFINYLGRLDYNMSDRSRLFFDVRRTDYTQGKNNFFNNVAEGSLLFRDNWGVTLDEVYTLSPRTVLDIRGNFTRLNEGHSQPGTGFDPTTLGFPASFASQANYLQLPVIALTTFQSLGANGSNLLPSQSFQLFGDVVTVKGSHTLKVGADARQYRLNVIQFGNSTGNFSFGNTYVRASSSASSTVAQGQDLASFLLGLPTAGSFDINTSSSLYSYYFAGFVQDDWRVTRSLTLNLGLRFDHETPYSEKYGRTVNGFDAASTNPLAAAAIAAYNLKPVAQIPVGSFLVPGGLTFAGSNDRAAYRIKSHPVSPRFGFAWSPAAFHNKTVIRGGFGMFVSPIVISNLSANGTYSTNPIINQEGFSATTSFTIPGGIVTPTNGLSDPFPSGFLAPAGSSKGLATFAGQTIQFLNPNMENPYSLRWNFDIQHNLTPSLLIEAVYIGNHALHLPVAVTQLNQIPRQFLSTLPTRDAAVNTLLSTTVPNPFAGLSTSQNTASTTLAQLLARFPQFPVGDSAGGWSGSTGVIEDNLTIGSSYFHALALRAEKRLSGGVSLTANYMFSKLIERTSWLNDSDPSLEKRISPFDHTHHFVIASSYEIPFGHGRRFDLGSRWANLVLGGWGINGIYSFQTGGPIVFTNGSSTSPGDYVYFGGPGALKVNARETNTAAFNTGLFATNSTQTFAYHIRTFSTTFPNVRQDGINQLDASMLKRINITERMYFQFRFEAFNLLNHPVFGAPNTTATNAGFGLITTQANRSRQIQLGGRFVF